MLRDLEHQPIAVVAGLQRRQDGGELIVEMHVDHRADDLRDATDIVGGARGLDRAV